MMNKSEAHTKTHSGLSSEALAKKGYKKTKLGWIPKEWELCQFDDVFKFVKSYSFSRNDLTLNEDEGDTYYIHYGDIHAKFDSLILHLEKENHAGIPLLKQASQPEKDLKYLREGDLVIADASEDYEGIGKCIEIGEVSNSKKLIGGLHTLVARDKSNKTVDRFRVYALKNWPVNKELKKLATGISVLGITKTNLSKLPLILPPLSEQKKIAQILSTWDEALDKIEQLITKKEKLKKGLMQQLLTVPKGKAMPKKRFPGFEGEWEKIKISSFAKLQGGYAFKSKSFTKKGTPVVRISNIQDSKIIYDENLVYLQDEDVSERYFINYNDILIAMSGATTGKLGVFTKKDKAYLNQRVGKFVVENPQKVSENFLKQLLFCSQFQRSVDIELATGAQPNISSKQIENIIVNKPKSLEEQEMISSMLNKINVQIKKNKDLKISFEKQKKGLMQQLLTGKTRVLS